MEIDFFLILLTTRTARFLLFELTVLHLKILFLNVIYIPDISHVFSILFFFINFSSLCKKLDMKRFQIYCFIKSYFSLNSLFGNSFNSPINTKNV